MTPVIKVRPRDVRPYEVVGSGVVLTLGCSRVSTRGQIDIGDWSGEGCERVESQVDQ